MLWKGIDLSQQRNFQLNKQWFVFFGAITAVAIGTGVHDSIFNNFLADTFQLHADARGWLEFPRELPGFLVVLMSGILCMVSITRIGVVATGVFATGMIGMSLLGTHLPTMVFMMATASAGMHLLMPVNGSVVLALSDEHNRGRRMGQAAAVGTTGTVIGTGLIWLFFDRTHPPYAAGFLCVSGLVVVAGCFYGMLHIPGLHQPRARLIVRRRFKLYYLLELLAGARKQIFLTFGPWVLIKVYDLPAASMAKLLFIAAVIGIFFQPAAGAAVDRFGERAIMIVDGLILFVVCLGYGYAQQAAPSHDTAQVLASACYILDQLLFSLSSARSVYISRLTENHQELNATLALGVSINHIASMTIPAFAGLLWVSFGYERVFLAAAILALCCAAASSFVPGKGRLALAGQAAVMPENRD